MLEYLIPFRSRDCDECDGKGYVIIGSNPHSSNPHMRRCFACFGRGFMVAYLTRMAKYSVGKPTDTEGSVSKW